MIAFNVSEGVRDEFVAFLSELTERLSRRFRHKKPEARAEAVAESVAHAWTLFLSASRRGREVTPSTLAFYSGRMVEAGRKIAGTSTVDALADTPLSRQRIGRHVSLDTPGLPYSAFYTTFGDRRWKWPVIDYVAPHVDFDAFRARCSHRDRRLLEMKLDGCRQTDIAAALGVTATTICQRLHRLRRRWEATTAA